ncbi:hypothetical protein AMECASPLE_039760, partial [Ameca splendens]
GGCQYFDARVFAFCDQNQDFWIYVSETRTLSYTWPGSVSTCDTFLERGIVRASVGNNLMLTFYR